MSSPELVPLLLEMLPFLNHSRGPGDLPTNIYGQGKGQMLLATETFVGSNTTMALTHKSL